MEENKVYKILSPDTIPEIRDDSDNIIKKIIEMLDKLVG